MYEPVIGGLITGSEPQTRAMYKSFGLWKFTFYLTWNQTVLKSCLVIQNLQTFVGVRGIGISFLESLNGLFIASYSSIIILLVFYNTLVHLTVSIQYSETNYQILVISSDCIYKYINLNFTISDPNISLMIFINWPGSSDPQESAFVFYCSREQSFH